MLQIVYKKQPAQLQVKIIYVQILVTNLTVYILSKQDKKLSNRFIELRQGAMDFVQIQKKTATY